jgi:hypothetical protein
VVLLLTTHPTDLAVVVLVAEKLEKQSLTEEVVLVAEVGVLAIGKRIQHHDFSNCGPLSMAFVLVKVVVIHPNFPSFYRENMGSKNALHFSCPPK